MMTGHFQNMSVELALKSAPILPKELDLLSRPDWIPLTKDSFPAGSFGHAYFPPELEGRRRPSTILEFPLVKLFKHNKSAALAELSDVGIHTCADALNQPSAKLQSKLTTDNLTRFLHDLIVTPQGRLLAEVTGKPAIPVRFDREMEFVLAVNDAVDATLIQPENYKLSRHHAVGVLKRKSPVDQRFELWLLMVRLFGLIDGIAHTPTEVGRMNEFNVDGSTLKVKKDRAFGRLIHSKIDGQDPLAAARKILALQC